MLITVGGVGGGSMIGQSVRSSGGDSSCSSSRSECSTSSVRMVSIGNGSYCSNSGHGI